MVLKGNFKGLHKNTLFWGLFPKNKHSRFQPHLARESDGLWLARLELKEPRERAVLEQNRLGSGARTSEHGPFRKHHVDSCPATKARSGSSNDCCQGRTSANSIFIPQRDPWHARCKQKNTMQASFLTWPWYDIEPSQTHTNFLRGLCATIQQARLSSLLELGDWQNPDFVAPLLRAKDGAVGLRPLALKSAGGWLRRSPRVCRATRLPLPGQNLQLRERWRSPHCTSNCASQRMDTNDAS